jgi:CubicO group peptidase (beta-lactamase class C family)
MLIRLFFVFTMILCSLWTKGQVNAVWVDSIMKEYKIPELGYAVISTDSIISIGVLGVKNIQTKQPAQLSDRFRIGSNTKTITSYIAALLVKNGEIKYDTKFFALFPELKKESNSAYWNVTLQDLLTFRAKLISWTYTDVKPAKDEIRGNEEQQRYSFVSWILKQSPDTVKRTVYWSNPSYVAAGLMLEKASGKKYKELVNELGKSMEIDFQFGQPNVQDIKQTWGHDSNLEPEKPSDNYKLNWLSSAGNINVTLPDFSKFIQMQLRGLQGKSNSLTKQEFETMHFGLPGFSFGWLNYEDQETKQIYSFHQGNPGTFLSQVYISSESNRAFVFFTNVQSDEAKKGLTVLFNKLKAVY